MKKNSNPRPPLKGTFKALFELISALVQRKKYHLIDKIKFSQLLASNEQITVVDCRDPQTFSLAGHIDGAINLPYTDFMKNYTHIPQGRPVVVVCYVGAYSRAASQKLAQNGYGQVLSLLGGMEGWIDAEYPVTKGQ